MGRPRVVIVGAGFAGLACARRLVRRPVDVVLVDRNNYHLFTPLLYQVASSLINPSDIAYPVRTVFRGARNVRFRQGEVVGIDLDERRVRLADGWEIPYDRLVLAPGSATNHFGLRALEHVALGLKDLPEAMQLRNHILSCFERAAVEPDPVARRRLLTVVIVGGGPTGVEYAGALSELIRLVLVKDFPEIDSRAIRIVLVEALPRVFPMFRGDLARYAEDELRRRRIVLRTGQRVVDVEPGRVKLSGGEVLRAETLVWAAGVEPASLVERLPLARSTSGRIALDPDLTARGRSDVFALGDAASLEQDGEEIPMLAPPAMQQGWHAAGNLLRSLAGKPMRPFRYRDKGIMATIGRKAAVAQVGSIGIRGWLGWVAWLVLHLAYIIGFRNRIVVLLGWAWEYVRYDRPVRLIARAKGPEVGTALASPRSRRKREGQARSVAAREVNAAPGAAGPGLCREASITSENGGVRVRRCGPIAS